MMTFLVVAASLSSFSDFSFISMVIHYPWFTLSFFHMHHIIMLLRYMRRRQLVSREADNQPASLLDREYMMSESNF
jgi:hypothetical protein